MQENLVIIIAGPTASGKSQLALDLAVALDGVIINADSQQVYQDTPILSAVPNEVDKAKVPHKLYEIFPASKHGNVVEWLDLAVAEIKKTWEEKKVPIIVGGTGLYIDNLINGTNQMPEVRSRKPEFDLKEMYEALKEFDFESWKRLNPNDVSRVTRAYNVYKETGIPLSEWHKKPMIKKLPEASFLVIKIVPEVKEIDERCYLRFDKMMEQGALKEVDNLSNQNLDRNLPAMKALGVPELLDYLEGKTTLDEAVNLAKLHSRQYAKRQKTWFKNKLPADFIIEGCYNGEENILKQIIKKLENN